MCKSQIVYLPIAAPHGPCHVGIRHYSDLCAAVSLPESWAVKLGWFLRRLAQKIDGEKSYSLEVTGRPTIAQSDVLDAMGYGFTAMQMRLNDIHYERTGSAAPQVPVVRREKAA